MYVCPYCSTIIQYGNHDCPSCGTDVRTIAFCPIRRFFKLVLMFCGVHAFLWIPVIYVCISQAPDHIRPMVQGPVSLLAAIFLLFRGGYVAFTQYRRHRILSNLFITIILTLFPLSICLTTDWFIIQFLGISYAP
jgi:hypothetical protein